MAAKNETSKKRLIAAERQREALDLRRQGYSYSMIAERIGVSAQTCFRYVRDGIDSIIKETKEEAEEIRTLELERLDELLRALWPGATDGEPQAIDKALKIMERRAKMLGLDAPTKVAPTNPDGSAQYEGGGLASLLQAKDP
jgi:transposase-like protein